MTPRQCSVCQATKSKRWCGVRKARVLCLACYMRELNAKKRVSRPKVCVWAGE